MERSPEITKVIQDFFKGLGLECFLIENSSRIDAIGYDETNKRLFVIFKKLGAYCYFRVPVELFEAFKKAIDDPEISVGKFFQANVFGKFFYHVIEVKRVMKTNEVLSKDYFK